MGSHFTDVEKMAVASQNELLRELDQIEGHISNALLSAGQAITELAKDKPTVKSVESHTTNFLKLLETVDNSLSRQINYLTQVSTGQPHEGSCYASQKDSQMAWFRFQHVRSRLAELERLKNENLRARQQQSMQRSMSAADGSPIQGVFQGPGGGPLQSLQRSFSLQDPTMGLQRTFSHEPHP